MPVYPSTFTPDAAHAGTRWNRSLQMTRFFSDTADLATAAALASTLAYAVFALAPTAFNRWF